jgi:hypothetical protein
MSDEPSSQEIKEKFILLCEFIKLNTLSKSTKELLATAGGLWLAYDAIKQEIESREFIKND